MSKYFPMKPQRISLIALLLANSLFLGLRAQQLPLTSQYMFNYLLLNPAVAGTNEEKIMLRLQNRNQWVGLEGAPITQMASVHGRVNAWNIGLGAYVINDVIGPTHQLSFQTNYSYQFHATENSNLSFGLGLGLLQSKIDIGKLTTDIPNDNALIKAGAESAILPDAGFGALWYNQKFYLGGAVPHILGSAIKKNGFYLNRNYLLMGGVSFELNEEITIEPSVVVRIASPTPVSADINTRVLVKNTLWIGASYRTSDAVVFLAGIQLAGFRFGYSYDLTTSELDTFSHGSHEIMLGYDFIRRGYRRSSSKQFSTPTSFM